MTEMTPEAWNRLILDAYRQGLADAAKQAPTIGAISSAEMAALESQGGRTGMAAFPRRGARRHRGHGLGGDHRQGLEGWRLGGGPAGPVLRDRLQRRGLPSIRTEKAA